MADYNTTRSVDASVSLQKSQENVNKSIEGVNLAQKGLMESQTDMHEDTEVLDEVVVTALGIKREKKCWDTLYRN